MAGRHIGPQGPGQIVRGRLPRQVRKPMPHPVMSPDHVAVITGGADGIGFAAAKRFAVLGMKVCVADLGNDRLAAAEAELAAASPGGAAHVMAMAVDVSQAEEVLNLEAAVRERFGGTDLLMNNAGIQPGSSLFGTPDNWQRILAVNLWGVIHGSKVFAPRMIERLQEGDFYILCPDNDVPRRLDERRILWAAGDIVENRPALSRWHPDYTEAFARFIKDA